MSGNYTNTSTSTVVQVTEKKSIKPGESVSLSKEEAESTDVAAAIWARTLVKASSPEAKAVVREAKAT